MIYVYALVEALVELPPVLGVDGAPLGRRRFDGFDAVLSEHGRTDLAPSEESIRAHARVVDELVPLSAAVLPVRFGRAFGDGKALEQAIVPRAPRVREALARVRGCVELGVRVVQPAPDAPPSAASGREYMESRRARLHERERLAAEIDEPLQRLARARVRASSSAPSLLLSGAYLIEPNAVPAFRGQLEELQAAHSELTFACTGPWPPYSFSEVPAP